MAKMEKSVLAKDNMFEFEEENIVNERENSQQSAEETILLVQKKLHQLEFENVDKKQNCNIENLHVIGVDLLSKIQNLDNGFARAFTESRISELPVGNIEMSKLFAELIERIQLCLAELKQLSTLSSCANPRGTCAYDDLEILKSSDLISQKQQLSSPNQEDSHLVKELSTKLFEIEKLKSDNLHKENELEALRHRQKELETQICSVEKEKSQLEENMEIMRREVVVTAKFLDDLRSEMMELNSNRDCQISANKILAKKYSELENGKQEVEVYLSEVEEENLLLSERLCGLEENLIYLTDERESCYMDLQNSESELMNSKDEIIRRLEDEMEVQKVVMRQKMEEMHRQWLEVQEECEYLKIENFKLIEECSMLQKANGQLRMQKMELNEHCIVLEADLEESGKVFSNMLNKVDNLQRENQLLEEEILAQLQKKALLQDAILALKETISEIKFENEMLEASFVMLSRDYEELEAELSLSVQKFFNSCCCGKVALEDALGTQEALLKSDLADIQELSLRKL
ncbi:structural maintenance of chromosomes protein 3-like isoform X2 [Durio zibethinus]|uniref:Structural maintenance of chromosomes protein 3-like isoform X2 n=1 Tax=Durio zibethinus TaxID=66656 RepID=A0A6P5YT03_DURZI|nr:structural maintenance of chromosomes protein 3-like isoform X2 [Durio zibethinus]